MLASVRIPGRLPAFYRDQFLTQAGAGLRPGELLGLRRRRVQPERRRIEVLEVRYEAGKFGRGFKDRPKNPASIRRHTFATWLEDSGIPHG